jgi:hypothetical protein
LTNGAQAFHLFAGERFDDVPGLAAVARAVQRPGIGHARKVIDADVAGETAILVEKADRAEEGARLRQLLLPGLAAVFGRIDLASTVDVPTACGVDEVDIVLLAFVGHGLELAPDRIRRQRRPIVLARQRWPRTEEQCADEYDGGQNGEGACGHDAGSGRIKVACAGDHRTARQARILPKVTAWASMRA